MNQDFECPRCGRCCQALEEKQEPVAWRFRSGTWFNREVQWRYIDTLDGAEGLRGLQPLYTAPPKKEWVGLTDEEIQDLSYLSQKIDASNSPWFDCLGFYRAVEQALKEKNHG
jgi:hypothetical protein